MKSLSKLALCLLLAMSLTVSAFAAQVPDSLVAENLNGQQRLVKTYTLSPEVDPDELKEEDFSYDGYLYTWAYTTKVEHPYLESKTVTETVTVNEEADPHDVYGPFYRRYYHRRSFRLCCGNPR